MAEDVGVKISLLPVVESSGIQAAVDKAAASAKLTIPEVRVQNLVLSKTAQKALDINSIKLKKIDAAAAVSSLKKDLESIFGALQVDGLKISIKDGGLEATYKQAAAGAQAAAKSTANIGAELDVAQKKAAALGSAYKSAFTKMTQAGQAGGVKETALTQQYATAKSAYDKYIEAIKSGNTELIASTKQQADAAEAALSRTVSEYKAQGDAISKFNTQISQLKKAAETFGSDSGVSQGKLDEYNARILEIESNVASLGSLTGSAFTEAQAGIEGAIQSAKVMGAEIKSTAVKMSTDLNPVYNLLNQIRQYRTANNRLGGTGYDARLGGIEEDLNGIIKNGSYAKSTLAELRNSFASVKGEISAAGMAGRSFTAELGRLMSVIGSSMVVRQLFMYARQGAREMYEAVKQVDDAMTQLKIVTQGTDAQMQQFFDASAKSAKELGTSVSDVLDSVQTFSRLGFSLTDALNLSEAATIMSNTAATSVDEATTGLTAIIKGYGMDVSEAEHVADVLVSLGEHYAISAQELMEAFTRGGAALNATGTSFEKSAALFAAANSAIQDSSVIGTALKTVSARIRGAKSDLESMGESTEDLAEGFSKYRDELLALTGFDIMENVEAGDYKDIYDIFVGISQNWDNLSETTQSRVSEILGGTRQLSVISSLLNGVSDATGAYTDAMNAAGTATQANAIYLDSISGRVGQLQASFQVLSADILDSDTVKEAISLITELVDAIDFLVEHFGLLNTVAAGGGLFAFFKNLD